jgi:urease accessory protein
MIVSALKSPEGDASLAPQSSLSRPAPGAAELHVYQQGPRSVVSTAFACSPLRLLMPSNHGHAAWVFTSTYGGGLVGGDALRMRLQVGAGATTLLQTQASTKVYRSPLGASSALEAHVHAGGRLLVLPDPVVCFEGATYDQTQEIELHATASLVLMDWITAGRHASGERWAFDRYASRLNVRRDGELVLGDSLLLSSREGPLAERMDRFECLCLIALVGPAAREHGAVASHRIAGLEARARADLLAAAAPLGPGGEAGHVIRLAGVSPEAVGRAARDYLRFVPALLGDDPWARKW